MKIFACSLFMLVFVVFGVSCSDRDLMPMQVKLSRSVSKLPFVIALDQGLYEKYGLDIEVELEPSDFEGGIRMPSLATRIWRRARSVTSEHALWNPSIIVSGANGRIADIATNANARHFLSLAATDCRVRAYIVGKKGMQRLEDLKGKRLGVSSLRGNTGFVALLLAKRMGWDPIQDISIMANGNNIDALREGHVDAIVANERSYAAALQEGLPILEATTKWNMPLAGNSVKVEAAWLENPQNREAARRFLQAMTEGIALFHQDRELALHVLEKWHGITDRAYAETVYEGGRWIPRKPYPCYEGIIRALEVYDSNEMRKYKPENFYDDSLVRELDESGFIDSLNATKESMSPKRID